MQYSIASIMFYKICILLAKCSIGGITFLAKLAYSTTLPIHFTTNSFRKSMFYSKQFSKHLVIT